MGFSLGGPLKVKGGEAAGYEETGLRKIWASLGTASGSKTCQGQGRALSQPRPAEGYSVVSALEFKGKKKRCFNVRA